MEEVNGERVEPNTVLWAYHTIQPSTVVAYGNDIAHLLPTTSGPRGAIYLVCVSLCVCVWTVTCKRNDL